MAFTAAFNHNFHASGTGIYPLSARPFCPAPMVLCRNGPARRLWPPRPSGRTTTPGPPLPRGPSWPGRAPGCARPGGQGPSRLDPSRPGPAGRPSRRSRHARRCRSPVVPVRTITPSRPSCLAADAERSAGYGGSTRSIASTSTIRTSVGSIERKSRRSVWRAISPSAPASSTPVGPPPTTTNVSHSRCAHRIVLALGRLVREEDPAPDLERVLDRLEPGRERRPLVVAEVRVARAGRDDQVS